MAVLNYATTQSYAYFVRTLENTNLNCLKSTNF